MLNALIVIAALVFAVISHEYGHMVMIKICGGVVPEFGIGFGRKIGSFEFRGTYYRIGWMPLGGYVKPDQESFNRLPAYKRNMVYLAGPLVNILSAALILWAYWMSVGLKMGQSLDVLVIKAFQASLELLSGIVQAMVPLVWEMGAGALMGPVGAVGVAAQADSGSGPLVMLIVVMLFLSLGLFNLLPIPALDGGQILMTTLRIPAAIYHRINQSALYALLGLGLVIMLWDVYRIASGTLMRV